MIGQDISYADAVCNFSQLPVIPAKAGFESASFFLAFLYPYMILFSD
jgi:hypothetical protein